MSTQKPITFDKVIRVIVALAIIAVAVWLIDILRDVLLPFCVACLISYMLEPIVEFHQKHLHIKRRFIPVLLTLLEVLAVVVIVGYFFIPSVIDEIEQLDDIVKRSMNAEASSSVVPVEVQQYLREYLHTDNLLDFLSGTRIEAVINKSTTVLSAAIDFLMHTIEWLLTFIYVIFILLDYKRIMRGFRLAIPPKYRHKVYPILNDIKVNMAIYFRSQGVIALCAAVLYCIGFSLVGLPLAILMGITVGILYMIPYFQYVTLIPVTILCFIYSLTGDASFLTMMGQCLAVYVVSQCICDYILTPKIMGKTLGMNPAIILLSLSIWGTLLGIIGMIIALPVTALIIAYYKQYVLQPSKQSAPKNLSAIVQESDQMQHKA